MAFPNVTDIVATTIESRSKEIADNVTKNNALFSRLKQKGRVKPFSGGSQILQELSYAENGNFGWYSGYDLLPTAAQDVISAAAFAIKQAACPVVVSGLEQLQNAGKEQFLDLLEQRMGVAESTMANQLASAVYGDGTAFGGKAMTGLGAGVVLSPSTGTYGGIDRATWSFWRNAVNDKNGLASATTIQTHWNQLWASLVRGKNRPDLIITDNNLWSFYMASLQTIQRFTSTDTAQLGFSTVKFMDADVVLDGGFGGFSPTSIAYFLNTEYLFLRPHKDRNMVPLDPRKRAATNQDAEVQILGWAGNLTCSNASLQGYYRG